jgi:hypothetical protein
MAPVRQDVLDELRVAGVVVQPARVHEQMADVDRVGVVAAAAKQFDRGRCEMVGDRVVEAEAALLDEPQRGGGGERLRDARDPETGFGSSAARDPNAAWPALPVQWTRGETTASATPG